jgi:hypothetical protein
LRLRKSSTLWARPAGRRLPEKMESSSKGRMWCQARTWLKTLLPRACRGARRPALRVELVHLPSRRGVRRAARAGPIGR